jgi:hypothetical protein
MYMNFYGIWIVRVTHQGVTAQVYENTAVESGLLQRKSDRDIGNSILGQHPRRNEK